MKRKLGKFNNLTWNQIGHNWIKLLYQAIETTSQVSAMDSESDQGSEDLYSEDTEDLVRNHCCNISIEYYLIAAKKKDKVSIITLYYIQTRNNSNF